MSARIKAFLIHLIGSLLLASLALALVFLVWYPSPLAETFGVTRIFALMLGIDVIIGPLLTLLVYKVGKKTLKFDLTAILVVQLAMFAYGMHTVAIGRPIWFVFNIDEFYSVRATDITAESRQIATPEYRITPFFGPKWVAIHLPDDKKLRKQIISNTLKSGLGLFYSPSLYAPLDSQIANIQANAHPIKNLEQWNTPQAIRTALAQSPTATTWLPLWNDHQSMTVLLNKNGQVVAITKLRPW